MRYIEGVAAAENADGSNPLRKLRKNGKGSREWVEPAAGEMFVAATPNRTFDSKTSFLEKFKPFDDDLQSLGLMPVRNTTGIWMGELERSRVYVTRDPGTDEGRAELFRRINAVGDKYAQDSIMIVCHDPNGRDRMDTFDGVDAKQARDAILYVQAMNEYRAHRNDKYKGLNFQQALSMNGGMDAMAKESEYPVGATYGGGRLVMFMIDQYQEHDEQGNAINNDANDVGWYLRRARRRSAPVTVYMLDNSTGEIQSRMDEADESIARGHGTIRDDGTDDYDPKLSNTIEAHEEWNGYSYRVHRRRTRRRHRVMPARLGSLADRAPSTAGRAGVNGSID